MKKDKKTIIIITSVIIALLLAVIITLTVMLVKDKNNKKPSPSYVVSTTQGTTLPENTDSWIDFDDIANDIATATDLSTTETSAPSTNIEIPTMPLTSFIYVDQNGNVIDWEEHTEPTTEASVEITGENPKPTENNAALSEFDINIKGVITKYLGQKQYVVIPQYVGNRKVTGIGEGCFKDSDIKAVYVCDTVTYIGSEAFQNCENLESISFVSRNNRVNIGNRAFQNCEKLKTLKLPVVESMGNSTFENCTSLTSVDFGAGSLAVGDFAFSNCVKLREVSVPDTVRTEKIGKDIFKNCDLKLLAVYSPEDSDFAAYCKDSSRKIRVLPPKTKS